MKSQNNDVRANWHVIISPAVRKTVKHVSFHQEKLQKTPNRTTSASVLCLSIFLPVTREVVYLCHSSFHAELQQSYLTVPSYFYDWWLSFITVASSSVSALRSSVFVEFVCERVCLCVWACVWGSGALMEHLERKRSIKTSSGSGFWPHFSSRGVQRLFYVMNIWNQSNRVLLMYIKL